MTQIKFVYSIECTHIELLYCSCSSRDQQIPKRIGSICFSDLLLLFVNDKQLLDPFQWNQK